jgi:hypothetical protein
MGKNQHVVRRDNGWGVRGEGNERDSARTGTQREAFEKAREIAKNQQSDVIIHDRNGKFRDRNSYGNDPYPPKG